MHMHNDYPVPKVDTRLTDLQKNNKSLVNQINDVKYNNSEGIKYTTRTNWQILPGIRLLKMELLVIAVEIR
jgi:hypothetical protein